MSGRAIAIVAIILLTCLIVQISIADVSAAQNPQTPRIHGYVNDREGQPVPYASVYMYRNGTLVNAWNNPVTSDQMGYYAFNNVTPGDYSITASRNFYNVTSTVSPGKSDKVLNVTIPASTIKLRTLEL